jgi:hypothetical protein
MLTLQDWKYFLCMMGRAGNLKRKPGFTEAAG